MRLTRCHTGAYARMLAGRVATADHAALLRAPLSRPGLLSLRASWCSLASRQTIRLRQPVPLARDLSDSEWRAIRTGAVGPSACGNPSRSPAT